ncbi:MAG: phosphoserine transaminase [Pseudomonadota bacterium]|nr:phosphoserine transaminase [Pseudomonadota bacterium]MEC9236264.1 phosphoserine transaminase [Pseudomonadota bacterium]MED5423948.1 phosphoserine transaminase [Pseudomonadota bacterium]
MKPQQKPVNPNFSSGPCAKRPDWSLDNLKGALLGRSHRSGIGKARLKEVIELQRSLLGIPDDYLIGIVPASDTGAIEMALWSMLGARGVNALVTDSFSGDWAKDIKDHLKLTDVETFTADYGDMVDLSAVDTDRDTVFVYNGTTAGTRLPNLDWVKADRQGLTFCDATSAVFAYDMDWSKLDVTTWSWQKVLGGEAAHGMLVLSPRAVERLESYVPDRPLPKIFRMTKGGKVNAGLFVGETLNTPSMLAVEDCLDALRWVDSLGGVKASIQRCDDNLAAIARWVDKTDWVAFLAADESVRSSTSITLKITDPWFTALVDDGQMPFIQAMIKLLEQEGVAYDIKSYRSAPAGLRIWGGTTIESTDLAILTEWLDWAYAAAKAEASEKAA